MVIPFGGMMMTNQPTPPVIKEVHWRRWFVYAVSLAALCIFDVIAVDIFGAIYDAIMCGIVVYMIRRECLNMSQYCLMLFGLMCLIQTVFNVISLVGSIHGRKSQHSTSLPGFGGQDKTMAYTVVVEKHPFFDPTMGFKYNCQSAVKIATPALMLAGVVLSYFSYSAFPTDDPGDDYGDTLPLGGGSPGGFYGTGQTLGGGSFGGGGTQAAGRNSRPSAQRPFEGKGQRLGGN